MEQTDHPGDRRPEVIFFDVMDTLVRDPFHEIMPGALGMSLEEMLRHKHPTAWVDFELGLIDEATFIERFLPGRSWDSAGFCAVVSQAYRWLPGVEPLLAALRSRQRAPRLFALSNYPSWYRWVEQCCGLSRYLEGAFISHETGARKPDAEAYLRPCRALGIAPQRALFVDDRARNCAAAVAIGMDAIRFEHAQQLRAELHTRGLLPRLRR